MLGFLEICRWPFIEIEFLLLSPFSTACLSLASKFPCYIGFIHSPPSPIHSSSFSSLQHCAVESQNARRHHRRHLLPSTLHATRLQRLQAQFSSPVDSKGAQQQERGLLATSSVRRWLMVGESHPPFFFCPCLFALIHLPTAHMRSGLSV